MGLSYKPETGDTRESPAMKIVEILVGDGYSVEKYDPVAKITHPQNQLSELVENVDCIIILVRHKSMMDELHKIMQFMTNPPMVWGIEEGFQNLYA